MTSESVKYSFFLYYEESQYLYYNDFLHNTKKKEYLTEVNICIIMYL